MSEKYTIWILLALVAYVMFKDKLFAAGGVNFSGAAGTRAPTNGPAPSGNTWANTTPGTISPGPTPPTNGWDVLKTGVGAAGQYVNDYGFSW
jgi:hypothetical protein